MVSIYEVVVGAAKKRPLFEGVKPNYTTPYTESQHPMSKIFAERLKTIREVRGLSQSDLAKKSGLQAAAISHFETAARSPSFDNLRRLSDALSVTTDYLMGRVDEFEMAGPQADSLFRDIARLTEDDIKAMQMMTDALLKRKGTDA